MSDTINCLSNQRTTNKCLLQYMTFFPCLLPLLTLNILFFHFVFISYKKIAFSKAKFLTLNLAPDISTVNLVAMSRLEKLIFKKRSVNRENTHTRSNTTTTTNTKNTIIVIVLLLLATTRTSRLLLLLLLHY
jgi:hypothetical protein